MKNYVGKITVANYQLEEIINILLSNNYILELSLYLNDKIQISIYELLKREDKVKEKNNV